MKPGTFGFMAKLAGLAFCAILLVFSFCELLPIKGETWNGIVVGKSSQREVIQTLGEPKGIAQNLISTFYFYKTGEHHISDPHKVLIRFGVVQQIDENLLLYHPDEYRLVDLVSRFGPPDLVEWSTDEPGLRSLIFFKRGVIAEVVDLALEEAYVIEITYFKPCPCWSVGSIILDTMSLRDPFPESDQVGPKDPWFGTSKAYRGYCPDC